jgi:hypothetical protein
MNKVKSVCDWLLSPLSSTLPVPYASTAPITTSTINWLPLPLFY